MNREIKFEYIFRSKHLNTLEKTFYTIKELEEIEMEIILLEKNLEIVARRMFTGLKDKNEKEIYEGDIVEWGSDVYKIVFDEKKLKFGAIGISFNKNHLYSLSNAMKIIGNIFENKDLIKEY